MAPFAHQDFRGHTAQHVLIGMYAPSRSSGRGRAEIMYYAGDIAELLLAAALVATWRPEPRRATAPEPATPREATTTA
ncbi:hypothetical protein [Streptomyces oceani]|uniref:Uncharacterized protein n=1 Tax=Streptomyces oceani TaxID=1075402 RepID=A0A1E7KHW7_9ACTN|nr:hypothetical protein AN216_11285 [Streptomyces oceani]